MEFDPLSAVRLHCLEDLSEHRLERLCRRNPAWDLPLGEKQQEGSIAGQCLEIFELVRRRADAGLHACARRFGEAVDSFAVPAREIEAAEAEVPSDLREALAAAARNLREFHRRQLAAESPVAVAPGVTCWREARPIRRVGLYVPGGSAVLPSTVLMLGIPAQLAGCPSVALCTPPGPDGRVRPEVLAAARLTGITEIYRLGGAQAIAALALGTESIAPVDKIFGPGRRHVQTAKLLATLEGVAIDLVAGPSEVLVIADGEASPRLVASDLLAQAEHDADSRAVLATPSRPLAEATLRELGGQLERLPRRPQAEAALRGSFVLLTGTLEQAVAFSNRFAPEHLILQVADPASLAGRVTAAGSVFLGPWSPEVAGDYASGTNHTLPTSGAARAVSGVSVESFVTRISFQELTPQGLQQLAPTLETFARVEELEGHRLAVRRRLELLERKEAAT